VFLSFGPQPRQYSAYAEAKPAPGTTGPKPAPGTTGPTTDVITFYNENRGRSCRATYTLLSSIGALAAFVGTVWLLASLLADGGGAPAPGLVDNAEAPALPIGAFCGSQEAHGALLNAAFAQTVRFSATHVALIAICAVAFVAGAASTLNVLGTHRAPRRWARPEGGRWAIAVILPLVGAALAFAVADHFVGRQIAELFRRLFPIPAPTGNCGVLGDALKLKASLDFKMQVGAFCVAAAVSSLIVAAGCLAHRYERNDINGAWSDSYVLRQKLNTLLTLFFIGSILLVITNVALSSAMDWSSGLLDVVSDATSFEPPDSDKPHDAAAAAKVKAPAAAFASVKELRTSIGNFAGVLGSLLLIIIFVPALYLLISEVEFAGKCHADYDMRSSAGDPRQSISLTVRPGLARSATIDGTIASEPTAPSDPGRIVVAGWKTVQDWKEKHGLKLSFTSLTGSFIAVLAPILSTSVIDLSKIAVGSG
jgi:hypothetical protein